MGACQAARIKPYSQDSSSDDGKRVPVWLNIYDLLLMNYTTRKFGFGIYHTGVEVYGVEYSYSGRTQPADEQEVTGLRTTEPGDSSWIEDAIFRERQQLGFTILSPVEIHRLYNEMHEKYKGPAYNVVERNCNHFTREFLHKIQIGRAVQQECRDRSRMPSSA
eukprot:TRINITY_DN38796_c0_g1_i1.p1 TRINITY_DN38796_c0_g1~~TRINITY_DN38796_c0_g1_i1.p1  ORF type:complete len:163 (-),score=12.58 TRINITY_DN38796_c0_g1_i1:10-498(-)